ncbi:aldo/keto reductase [Neorhizobium sp. BETTINA12A]|uniref:aldo/keto reductase n=1 Tax=Neorhizobium sp. BETTINA12A TaxID=2908924 RepID=UPI001FF6EB8F|nr:aldo/keto reductase [Neorhizobium sp. BETTINA12A]MCJ9751406.1 aldo/keto reductase [Neorhizobium sp. BETTINA12A]
MENISLGLGLLSIGREWGVTATPPPHPEAAKALIKTAFEKGIRFFDTAPAYAQSEQIFGQVLKERLINADAVIVATKVGEHWDNLSGNSYIDHSFTALSKSIRNSVELLGKIDLLQIHKADRDNVQSSDVMKALDFAAELGVKKFGVSVSDVATAEAACQTGRYTYIQFPFNQTSTKFASIFDIVARYRAVPIVNRPFAMGALSSEPAEQFRFVMRHMKSGIILTGTSSIGHLVDNVRSFQKAAN